MGAWILEGFQRITDAVEQTARTSAETLQRVEAVLERLEEKLDRVLEAQEYQGSVNRWYSTADAAELLDKRPYTVREWCRTGRVNARKREAGRGEAIAWEISHEEIERIKSHGLLPLPSRN